MMHVGGRVGRWFGWLVVLAGVLLSGSAVASTYSTGTNRCSSCHGVNGSATPPMLPSQGSNILQGADLTDSCASNSSCSLRNVIKANGTMGPGGVDVSSNFSNAELDAVRLYLLQVKNAEVASGGASFSDTVVGQSATSTFNVTVRNYRGSTGGTATEGSINYSFSKTGADFSIDSATGGNCAASASTSPTVCTISVTVRFTPGSAGPKSGTLNVNLAANGAELAVQSGSVSLSANGIAAVPSFSITPASRTFVAKVGEAATQSFTISNPGTAALSLTAFNFSSTAYTRDGSSTCSTSATVAAGGNCSLVVRFAPAAAGVDNASLSITHNASGSPASVTLDGTGTIPTIALSSTSQDFGNSQLGVPKAGSAITISNTGSATLVFSVAPNNAAALSGAAAADYSFSTTCGGSIAAGGNCTVTGSFQPSALGTRSATLTISSDASNGNPTVALTGSGVALPEPVVTFPSLAFPDTVIGETGAQTRQLTISNSRTRDITYVVADGTDFKIDAESCPTHTVPGDSGGAAGSCTITWRFQPALGSGEGTRQETIPISFGGTGGDANPSNTSGQLTGRALLPVSLSATTLNAAAVVGTPGTSSLVVTNRSASSVTLNSLAFSGAQASDYSLAASNTCTVGGALAAGASCTLAIRFDPPAAGTRNAVLTITHTAPGSPQTVTITGTATPAPQGRIALSALALAFPDTELGGSSSLSVTVRNTGDLALNFSAFTLGGTHAADFARSGSCSTATPLAINAQCTLTMRFTPGALGARSASLTIQSDASNGAATLSLAGTGVPVPAPQVTLAPASIDFGVQTVGGLYPGRTVRLTNSGTADLTVSAITTQGTGFTANATACPGTLPAGEGCDIVVGFAPNAAGTDFTGSLRVGSNAAGSPHSVTLRGRGSLAAVPVLTWSPAVATLDFGEVPTGTVSAVQSATLLNQGPGGVTLNLLNAVGAGAAAFSVSGGTCQAGQTLFEGQTCRVDVSFAPAVAGARSATVQVASDGSAPPELSLRGTGLGGPAPAISLSLSAMSFQATRVGDESLPGELVLRSSGSGSLRITALAVSGPFVVAPKSCPGVPFSLPAGGECTLSVSFMPNATGDLSGTLRITADTDPADVEVALSGHGDKPADVTSGGGGCSMADGDTLVDPTLWALVLLAGALLMARRRARRGR